MALSLCGLGFRVLSVSSRVEGMGFARASGFSRDIEFVRAQGIWGLAYALNLKG